MNTKKIITVKSTWMIFQNKNKYKQKNKNKNKII